MSNFPQPSWGTLAGFSFSMHPSESERVGEARTFLISLHTPYLLCQIAVPTALSPSGPGRLSLPHKRGGSDIQY